MTRFGPSERVDGFPVWTPNGMSVAFAGGSPANLFLGRIDGSPVSRLTRNPLPQFPSSWSPNGKTLAYVQRVTTPSYDPWLLSFDREIGKSRPLLTTPAFEQSPEFSPDGDWIAYVSDESGQEEVYVRPFPGPGPPTVVSTGGGSQPAWARSGRELFYVAPSRAARPSITMMAVAVATRPTFSAGTPRLLFTVSPVVPQFIPTRSYDVATDGRRFLMSRLEEGDPSGPDLKATTIELILNWGEELKRRAPSTR
jgi:serine/threonine-protein kinase